MAGGGGDWLRSCGRWFSYDEHHPPSRCNAPPVWSLCRNKMSCESKDKKQQPQKARCAPCRLSRERSLDRAVTGIDNPSPTNQRMLRNTEPKGSDTKGAVLPLNEDRAYPIPEASAPPERRPFFVALPAFAANAAFSRNGGRAERRNNGSLSRLLLCR
jgi:hypothetical protein